MLQTLEEQYNRISNELLTLTNSLAMLSAAEERRRNELEAQMWELERTLLLLFAN